MHIKISLLLVAALVLLIMPAYATVMETGAPLRDKLPASTLADMPSFIEDYRSIGSKVSFDSTGHYTIYNENDLKRIFGEDAVLVPSPPGLLTITYKRGGVYKFWGMLHGLVIADSARKTIAITKGGFISPEDIGVNIAGDEIVIDARNPARSTFKISREGVYAQNKYFLGCEPEQEATADETEMNCDLGYYSDDGVEECNFMEMQAYEADLRNIRDCNIKTVISPQYSYANITGKGWIFKIDLLKEYYDEANIDELLEKAKNDSEYSYIAIRDLSSLKIENNDNLKFIAAAPSEGSLGFQHIKSEELFEYSIEEYSTPMEGKIISVTGDKFDFYGGSIPGGILFKVEDVGNTPHMDKSIRFFHGWWVEDENAFEIMNLKNGKAYFYESREDIEDGGVTDSPEGLDKENPFVFSCLKNIPAFGNMGCVYKTYKEAGGRTLDYYKIYPKGETSEPMLLEISSSITFSPYDVWGDNKAYVEVKPFGINDDLSRVRIVNNANTAIDFTGKDITITPVAGDWTELGVSFKASIYPLSLPAQCDPGIFIGEECAIGETIEVYDTIECKLTERKCYLNGVEVTGFIDGSVQRTKFCHEDSQCYDNQKCIDGLCVMKATCGNIRIESERGTLIRTTGMDKADVLFIGDGYSSEEELKQHALKIIDEKGENHGLFSTPPFSENDNIKKFVFHSMYGSAAPKTKSTSKTISSSIIEGEEIKEGLTYLMRYVNGYKRQCPSADYTILLFKDRQFRAQAVPTFLGLIPEAMGEPGEGAYIPASEEPIVTLHEFGHLFSWLRDEYREEGGAPLIASAFVAPLLGVNCVSESDAPLKWGADIASRAISEGWRGCGGNSCGSYCDDYLRPSLNSIMRNEGIKEGETEEIKETVGNGFIFNEPSKKQLIEKLNAYS